MNRESGQSPVMGELSSESSRADSRRRPSGDRVARRWLGLAFGGALAGGGGVLVAVPLLGSPERFSAALGDRAYTTYKSAIAKLPIVVQAPGDLESAENLSVVWRWRGRTRSCS